MSAPTPEPMSPYELLADAFDDLRDFLLAADLRVQSDTPTGHGTLRWGRHGGSWELLWSADQPQLPTSNWILLSEAPLLARFAATEALPSLWDEMIAATAQREAGVTEALCRIEEFIRTH
jgi:hypothetical protein